MSIRELSGNIAGEGLRAAALAVLQENDLGRWTKPAPRLYPHQWSWDSAFVAIGLAHSNVERALLELETLFEAQWSDGRVPHIVFNPESADYFPGPERWDSTRLSPNAPRALATSGLIQPPVHAIALSHVAALAPQSSSDRVRALVSKMMAWHRYLASQRDPERSGLLVIYHPWESGTDNSPRWDAALARLKVGEVPAYVRHDLKHVADASQRPSQAEYDRYLWLVELLKRGHYDDATIQREYPFQVRDVLMSAIFAAANAALAELAELPAERAELTGYTERFSAGVENAWDDELLLALDWDVNAGSAVRVETCAGLAPIVIPSCSGELLSKAVERLTGPGFMAADGFLYPVVPSTAPGSPGFAPRAYWRGPSWPVANWLLWWGLLQHRQRQVAAQLRSANLALLSRPAAEFAEYFEPYTAEPLGSLRQSWTAAVVLDWLARRG